MPSNKLRPLYYSYQGSHASYNSFNDILMIFNSFNDIIMIFNSFNDIYFRFWHEVELLKRKNNKSTICYMGQPTTWKVLFQH